LVFHRYGKYGYCSLCSLWIRYEGLRIALRKSGWTPLCPKCGRIVRLFPRHPKMRQEEREDILKAFRDELRRRDLIPWISLRGR
jgi:RNase P subunit RPR2